MSKDFIIKSAAGGLVLKITPEADVEDGFTISSNGKYSWGCFSAGQIEDAIRTLAESIGKVATLTDEPEPVLTFADLEVGTVFTFYGGHRPAEESPKYIKLPADHVWSGSGQTRHPLKVWELDREVRIVEFDE